MLHGKTPTQRGQFVLTGEEVAAEVATHLDPFEIPTKPPAQRPIG